jgi:response regulator RpfG family c-di-GMP phosphodiesterase
VQKLGVSAYLNHEEQLILAATGDDSQFIGKDPRKVLPAEINAEIQHVLNNQETLLSTHRFIGYFRSSVESEAVIYISSSDELSLPDRNLLGIFLRNVSIGIEHLHLREEIEQTQNEIVYMLGDAVESRSRETANHVRRVAENSKELAQLLGLDTFTAQILHSAAPLHDVGKIGIPDRILDKPASLTDGEWGLMQTHAQRGADLLSQSNRPILKAAAIIAVQHHENWDGSGYPNGLAGDDIHIYGRIVAIADVYDALCSKRCYKSAWEIDKVLEYMKQQKGKKFDPELIDLLINNHDRFVEIRNRYPDQ